MPCGALRQDPDVILVGEMRDMVIEIALRAWRKAAHGFALLLGLEIR